MSLCWDSFYSIKILTIMETKPPLYRPVINDGASFTCIACGQPGHANDMWYIATPNGYCGVSHKDCVDDKWLKLATFVPTPI